MRTFITAVILILIVLVFCSPLAAQTARPAYLFLLEGKGVPTGTIHVFSTNSSTGAVTEVPGSPYNAGLIPDQLVVDPTGRFVYITNDQSEDITAYSVDASTGALTALPGSPFPIGAAPVTAAVDPTGRFLYVFATNVIGGVDQEFLYEYTIDSVTGVLTSASTSPTTWEFVQGMLIVSIAFNPGGNYAYLGQVAGGNLGAPTLICSVDFSSGTLSPVGSIQPGIAGEANDIAVSPNGGFLYSINATSSVADAFAVGSGGGSLTEVSGSPYVTQNFPSSLVVHPSGNFLYVANENQPYQTTSPPDAYNGSIAAFAIHSGTGELSQVSGSPFAAGINPISIVVDPSGHFAYSTSTMYTTGYTGFAQILGFSIDASTGFLTPLSGTPWTDSAQSVGGGLAISSGPAALPNPVPMISSLSPPAVTAAAVAFTLQVNGANFVPGSTVYFGGQARATTFVNSGMLNASILANDVDNDGTAVVFVFNPLPGGGASTSVEFPVSALSPIISSIAPPSVIAGQIGFTLAVIGSNFVTSSVVNFNGSPLATPYSSPTVVTASVPVADIAAAGTAGITVTSPTNGVPGGGTSNEATLTILPAVPSPLISGISPTSATAGGPAFTLTVNGSGFVQGSQGTPDSQVSFNLNNVPTMFVNSTQLTAMIPASAIAIAGNPYVIVTNPNGFASAQVTFTIMPGLGSITPPSLPAGSSALTLNVSGTGFAPGSVVLVNGSSRATAFESSTLLQATLLPADLSQGGTLNITVLNPGGGASAAISFVVADYSVKPPGSPSPVTAGETARFTLDVSSSSGTFSNPVLFGISSQTPLPAGAADSFAPSTTITPGATPQIVTLSITTTAHAAGSTIRMPGGRNPALLLLCLAGMGIAMGGFWLRACEGRVRRLVPHFLLVLLLVAAAGLVACGAVGGGYSASQQVNPATGTPAGTYPITVTATSGGVSHTATITLAVM